MIYFSIRLRPMQPEVYGDIPVSLFDICSCCSANIDCESGPDTFSFPILVKTVLH